jgi:hypothetical protein
MKLGMFLSIVSVAAFVFGLGFLLLPEQVLGLFGVTLDASGILFARLLWAAITGYGVLDWFARNAQESEARRAIVLAGFTWHALGFVVFLLAQLAGITNALGWLNVGLLFLFALGFAYFMMPMRAGSTAPNQG